MSALADEDAEAICRQVRCPVLVVHGRVERMRRYPRLRDQSIFVGNPDDLVDVPLGPELPTVRDWALERYTCTGYVTGSTAPEDREALRRTGLPARRTGPAW